MYRAPISQKSDFHYLKAIDVKCVLSERVMWVVKVLKIIWLLLIISIYQCNAGILGIYKHYRFDIEDKNRHILNQTPFIQLAIQYLYRQRYNLTHKLVPLVYHSQYCSDCYDTLFDLEEIFQKNASILPAIGDLILVFKSCTKCEEIKENIGKLKIKINGEPVSNDKLPLCNKCNECKICDQEGKRCMFCKKCKVCKPVRILNNQMLMLEANENAPKT
jgi:hypothetical protein